MRAYEFITEDRGREPEITLRSLNRWNHEKKEREASHRQHAALVRIMYNDPDRELKQIELEKARLELEELRAEIAKTLAIRRGLSTSLRLVLERNPFVFFVRRKIRIVILASWQVSIKNRFLSAENLSKMGKISG